MPSAFDRFVIAPGFSLWLAVGILLNLSTVAADSLDAVAYDARLCTAGIVVLGADIAKLRDGEIIDSERDWLQQRVNSLAGTLGWLCKRYALANGLDADIGRAGVTRLRESIGGGSWIEAVEAVRVLGARMPPDFDAMLPDTVSAGMVDEAAAIYRRYCQGCHARSSPRQIPPVYSLRLMAHRQPATEFIARMLIGVHGTPEIGLRNPLSSQDIAGMYSFLLRSAPAGDGN